MKTFRKAYLYGVATVILLGLALDLARDSRKLDQ
jgi:hypothetical protein